MTKVKKKVAKKTTEKRLTKLQQRRVDVAKDAIAQLKAGRYLAQTGSYIELSSDDDLHIIADNCELFGLGTADKIELKHVLPNLVTVHKPCQTCLKGALAISSISKFNNITLQEFKEVLEDDCILEKVAQDKTRALYGYENADLMEEYFEGWDEEGKYIEKYPEDTDRLIAILKNVIKNKGIFKP